MIFIINYYLVLDPVNCQNINGMTPLNDLLLGQTFLIETNDQPLFVNGTEVKNFDFSLVYYLILIWFFCFYS